MTVKNVAVLLTYMLHSKLKKISNGLDVELSLELFCELGIELLVIIA